MKPEICVRVLRGLINYHERVMLGEIHCVQKSATEQNCPVRRIFDPYKDALQEAVRCVKIVHQLEDNC